jgi:hypothetical protein
MIYLVEEEASSGSYLLAAAFIGVTYFLGNKEWYNGIFSYVVENPGTVILYVLGYIILGAIWSIVRWFIYLKGLALNVDENGNCKHYKSDFDVFYNKGRIMNWMFYWPISVIWTVIDEPIKKSFKWIYSKLEGSYKKISDNITKDIKFK